MVRDHDATVRKMAADGATLRQIADAVGCAHENIWAYLKKHKILIDRRKRVSVPELRKAMVMHHD